MRLPSKMASIKTKDLDKTSLKYAQTALWFVNFILVAFAIGESAVVTNILNNSHTLSFLETGQQGIFSPAVGKMAAIVRPECVDFLQFQDILKRMRELDDKIIYTLNATLPTESFKGQNDSSQACKELFGQLQQNSDKREKAIQQCINFTKENVLDLKNKKESNSNDLNVIKALRKEQSKLKFLQTELGVEEVVKDKTSKIIYERCRMHYVPPNFNI